VTLSADADPLHPCAFSSASVLPAFRLLPVLLLLSAVLQEVRSADTVGPVLVHVITEKGRGYLPAETAQVGRADAAAGRGWCWEGWRVGAAIAWCGGCALSIAGGDAAGAFSSG
jgi:hypothetical protein